jgi:hypothetical protein
MTDRLLVEAESRRIVLQNGPEVAGVTERRHRNATADQTEADLAFHTVDSDESSAVNADRKQGH